MGYDKVLLVEPSARTSFPPLGLMKIATYHRLKGDDVFYVVGCSDMAQKMKFDYIYITSLFTYDYKALIKTIIYYKKFQTNLRVGGIAASLLAGKIKEATDVDPHVGLLRNNDFFLKNLSDTDRRFFYLKECGCCIDNLPPSYNILHTVPRYDKLLASSYILFSTKGCPNQCEFCAVSTLEPDFIHYIPLEPRIRYISDENGEKNSLILLDNNIAASSKYFRIIDEIKDAGFKSGSVKVVSNSGRVNYKKRSVDFNQGVDMRLMDKRKMQKMAEIAISPLRLAFDSVNLKDLYIKKVQLAIGSGISSLSNYMLYNFNDKPEDLYERMLINTKLKEDNIDIKFFSFPMRFNPVYYTDRSFVGKHWSRRYIRALQVILNATHGIVSHKPDFFYRAFGVDGFHFSRILLYPYNYILNRNYYEYNNGRIKDWERDFSLLSKNQVREFIDIIKDGKLLKVPKVRSIKIMNMLGHYVGEHCKIVSYANRNEPLGV